MNYISKYNIFTEDFVYNLISKNYLQINENLKDYLKTHSFLEEEFPDDILKVLKRNNIVVDYDELQYIDSRYNSLKFNDKKAAFIIYPTLSCNFSCDYCFETIKNGSFRNKETTLLKKFFKNKLKVLDEINIRWSGGEPLLTWEKIKDISSVFRNYKGSYNASIATNGYFLTEQIAEEMRELNFSSVQITVDGSKHDHNKKRFTNTDTNTYEKVLQGIKNASKYINTRIRFNVDQNNRDLFVDFLNDLDKYQLDKTNIEIYVKPVVPKNGCTINDNLLEGEDFLDVELEYLALAKDKNFKYSLHPNFKSEIRCIYHHVNSFAIDPKLNLYKCAEYIGMEAYQIGRINENSNIKMNNTSLCNRSLMYSPISLQECRECKVLPICNGKCPIDWEKNNRKEHAGCIPEKKSIEYKIAQLIKNEL
jgi:uncharacterized protein